MTVRLIQLALVGTIVAMWQILVPHFNLIFFFSTPAAVAESFFRQVMDGTLFYHTGITVTEAIGGFLLGGSIGMILGILLGRSQLLSDVLSPFITTFYSMPKVALAPLFILWFGIGLDMKIYLAASIVFFLVFLNTFHGVREVSQQQIAILKLMNANEWHLLSKVIVPSAIVWVFAGLRLSVPYALIGAIVGEIIASNRGLGYLLAHSAGMFDTAGTFAALIAIMILSMIFHKIVNFAEHKLMPWRSQEHRQEITV